MRPIKKLFTIFVIAFILNLIWENAQAPLYQGYISFAQHFWICLPASIWDASYITTVYLAMRFVDRTVRLIQKTPDQEKSVSPVLMTIAVIALGLMTAGYIELRALAQDHWAYSAAMPLVPVIHVGLTPFLQLAILSLVTYTLISASSTKK